MRDGMKILDMRCRPPYRGFLNEGYPFGLYDMRASVLMRKMTNTMAPPRPGSQGYGAVYQGNGSVRH